MKYVVPQTLSIETTNVPLGDYTEYSPSTTYNTDSKVTVLADKKNYICVADGTIGKTPKDNPLLWISEPMNAYALLDLTNAKATTQTGNMIFSYRAINIDSISLFGVNASSVNITVENVPTSTVIFNQTFNMESADIEDFGDYLFTEQELSDMLSTRLTLTQMQAVVDAMTNEQIITQFTANPPIYYDVRVTITLTGTTTALAYLISGRQRELGVTLSDGTTGLKSFSKKERNQWGTMVAQKGNSFDAMDLPILIDSNKITIVKKRLKDIDAIPCVFISSDSFQVFGVYFDLEMPLTSQTSEYNLRLESTI